MSNKTIKVNRAPVMTLWAAVVAERLGFDREEALTLGKGVAGLNAQSKGQRLGIFTPGEEKGEKAREREVDEEFFINLLGRAVPVVNTREGVRSVNKGRPVDPRGVERYLEQRFGEDLPEVRQAMEELAQAYKPGELAGKAYPLYEKFRPEVPEGAKGWGAQGDLSPEKIRELKP